MRFSVILVFMLLVFMTQAHSTPTLVVTSIKPEGRGYRYFYSVRNWTTQDPTPSVCGDGGDICVIMETVMFGPTFDGEVTFRRWGVPVSPGYVLTIGDILRVLNSQGEFYMPYSTSVLVEGYGEIFPNCIKLQIFTGGGYKLLTECAPLTAPPVKCDLYGKTNIDYSTLSDNALDGARASTKLNFKCSGSASITVKATRTNSYGVRLRSDESLYSEVKVNDKDATNGINMEILNNVNTPILIGSTLKTRGRVAPGPFSGSTVITVAPN